MKKFLNKISEYIDVIDEYLADNDLLESKHGGLPRVVDINEEGIVVMEDVKTGDGVDRPYYSDPRIVWSMEQSDDCYDTEGVMYYYDYLYCSNCDELYDAEKVKRLMCPKCGEQMVVPTTPKWLYFRYVIRFDKKVKNLEELDEEFEKMFGVKLSVILTSSLI